MFINISRLLMARTLATGEGIGNRLEGTDLNPRAKGLCSLSVDGVDAANERGEDG